MPVLEMVTYVIRAKAKKMNATFGNYDLNNRLCAQAQRGTSVIARSRDISFRFSFTSPKMSVQLHLNKFECCGKVHLFQ